MSQIKLTIDGTEYEMNEYNSIHGDTSTPSLYFNGMCFTGKAIPHKKFNQNYEILSIASKEGGVWSCDKKTFDWDIKNKGFVIHQVMRLSDNEVFTVGNMGTMSCIKSFVINDNQMYVKEVLGAWSPLNILKKSKPILFTTNDGFDIYEPDTWIYVLEKTGNRWSGWSGNAISMTNDINKKYFLKKENWENFAIENTVLEINYKELYDFIIRQEKSITPLKNSIKYFFKNKIKL